MKSFPIYLNYDLAKAPIGHVVLDVDIPEKTIQQGAIVPYLVKKSKETEFKTTSFGFIPRTKVNVQK